MTVDVAKIKTIIKVKEIKGTSFVGVRNYTNAQGEVANHTLLVGINYENHLRANLMKLGSFNIATMFAKYPNDRELVLKGYKQLLDSLEKRTASEKRKAELRAKGDSTIARSDAQRDAYFTICKGLRAKDQHLHINGIVVRKTVLVPIEYGADTRRDLTKIKNDISRTAKLMSEKFKNFKLGRLETVNVQGVSIQKEAYDF